MAGNMVSIGVVLGVFGMLIAIASLIVAVEVGRRCQAMMLEHAEQIAVMVRDKLNEQEEAFNRQLSEQRKRLSEIERTSAHEKNLALEATNRLQSRIGSQDALIGDALAEVRKRIGSLEYSVSSQATTLAELRTTSRRSREQIRTHPQTTHVT